MNVTFNPQDLIVTAVASALDVKIENPVGQQVLIGMAYESGEWTQSSSVTSKMITFTMQHKNPPFMFLVYAVPSALSTYTAYGELFVNYLSLHGTALQTTLSEAKYGLRINWSTGSGSSTVGQSVTTITTKDGLSGYATNEGFTFSSYSNNTYIRNGKKYSWIAVFMPE